MKGQRSNHYRDDPALAERISESSRWLLRKAMQPAVEAMERDAALLARGIWPKDMRR